MSDCRCIQLVGVVHIELPKGIWGYAILTRHHWRLDRPCWDYAIEYGDETYWVDAPEAPSWFFWERSKEQPVLWADGDFTYDLSAALELSYEPELAD